VTTKRTGRPPLDPEDQTVRLGLSLPAKQFDAYARRAIREDVSVPEIIRRTLRERKAEREGKE
jgi:hypothetical protein